MPSDYGRRARMSDMNTASQMAAGISPVKIPRAYLMPLDAVPRDGVIEMRDRAIFLRFRVAYSLMPAADIALHSFMRFTSR